ncbi:MAG: hypothetical protein K0S61_4086 [Anaerocolumna sp.]|jgi:hypothetical protein|nr:hypothetical protein [Anaerocolumna sp.]
MSVNTVSNLIEVYSPKLVMAGKTPPYSDVSKLLKEFSSEVHLLEGVEDEIESYLKEAIFSKKWGKDYDLWFIAVLEHPSMTCVNYLLSILDETDANFPYWKALDVLAYMPQSISENIVPRLIQIIESNNVAWSDEDLKKAFETLVWIGSKEGIDFISRACDSSVGRIADMAKYWVSWMADDDDEDSE